TIQLQDSVDGATEDNEELERLILAISTSNADIVREIGSPEWQRGVDKKERATIVELGHRAEELANELLRILNGLKSGSNPGQKGSLAANFLTAVKTMMKNGEIEKLQLRIDGLMTQMSHRLLRVIL